MSDILTVGKLIEQLKALPPDSEVHEIHYYGQNQVKVDDTLFKIVWLEDKANDPRLYIDCDHVLDFGIDSRIDGIHFAMVDKLSDYYEKHQVE